MEQQGAGTISANDLMSKLVKAKKLMNMVDDGNYQKGNVDESILRSSPEEVANKFQQNGMDQQQPMRNPTRSVSGPLNVGKIQESRLPDAIKQAMINHPIQQMPSISLNETLDMDFIKGAKRLMEQEGVSPKKNTQTRSIQESTQSFNIDMKAIEVLIENTIRKVLDEKLNQLLTAHQTSTINENLVLKVGDSVFKGRITGVNKAK
jgi:hypothetical protein